MLPVCGVDGGAIERFRRREVAAELANPCLDPERLPRRDGLDLPRHLTHFTPATLHLMLERAGFCPGAVRMVRHSDWMRQSAKLARRYRHGPPCRRWLTAKPAARLASWYTYVTRQTDCLILAATR